MKSYEFLPHKLVVFDIDDTLVRTQTKVKVILNGEIVKTLNSHEFTHYKLHPGEEFDFDDFKDAHEFFTNAKPIIPMISQLKHDIATGNKVTMIISRNAVSIYDYENGINEAKRNINLINSTYVSQVEKQYQTLVKL